MESPANTPGDALIKSPNDPRSYRILHLPNGLFALLAHDPQIYSQDSSDDGESESDKDDQGESDSANGESESNEDDEGQTDSDDELFASRKKAAVALCVGVGSLSDPINAPGLAHLLEHIITMGSSEFPEENEYRNYLSNHGGLSNAFTELEHTCYFFHVNPNFLQETLKRFSQFFISPLMKAETIEREVQAVDAEFKRALPNDRCRLRQLQFHTSLSSCDRFPWGNKKTLYDALGNGVNIQEEVQRLFDIYYCAGLMKLVVIGGEPLDTLENWVEELFGKVRESPSAVRVINPETLPVWEGGMFYKLQAVNQMHILDLQWRLPAVHKDYLKKPHNYLKHIFDYEGKGSISHLLKKKGLITSMSAGLDEMLSFSSQFTVHMHLTTEGSQKVYEVIGAIYQYIKLIRQSDPQEWIFKELKEIRKINFKFAERSSQLSWAITLAGVKYEPRFGSYYIEENIAPSLADIWRDPAEINSLLHLPPANEFIPADLSLHNADLSKSPTDSNIRCILDEPLIKLWYKMDQKHKIPLANAYFLIRLKDAYSSEKNYVLTKLFINLVKDEVQEVLSQARIAGLNALLSTHDDKLELRIRGYNDKLGFLLSKILSVLCSLSPSIDQFKIEEEEIRRDHRNCSVQPLSLARGMMAKLFYKVNLEATTCEEKLLKQICLSDLQSFIPHLLSQMYIEGLCHGNLTEEEAIEMASLFKSTFNAEPLPKVLWYRDEIFCLPPSAKLLLTICINSNVEINSGFLIYYQIEQCKGREFLRMGYLVRLLESLIFQPFFDQLRTEEQLGYVVSCGLDRMVHDVIAFTFSVQSSEYDPFHLHRRVEHFVDSLPELLDGIDDKTFEHHKIGLVSDMFQHRSHEDDADAYWSHIISQRYFNLGPMLIEDIKDITKKDVIDFYKVYLQPESAKCRRLAVRVWGSKMRDYDNAKVTDDDKSNSWEPIGNIEDFKKSSEFYSC